MKKWIFLIFLSFSMLLGVCLADQPKNVILMISDGAGFNAFEAASYYQHGQLGQQVYDSFDVKIACTTYKLKSNGKPQGYDPAQMWSSFNYVRINPTDSAAAATAINSGVKTSAGAVNVNFNKKRLRTASEILEDVGKSTGAVTSVYFSHATPACVSAHNAYRNRYEQIANEMIYDTGLDVIMGCGEGSAGNLYVGGDDTWADIIDEDGANRFEYIADKNDFAMIADSNYAQYWPDKVLGICHATSTLSNNLANVPTLATMSVGALNVLSRNENGFYVMIEGGAVDWENHARNITGMVREQVGFNDAVEAVVDWIEDNGGWDKNLLMITSDHECGMIWGPNSYTDVNDTGLYVPGVDIFNDWNHVVNNGDGNIPGVQYGHTYHTNALVPFYAKGAGSEIFAGLIRGNDSNAGAFWDFSGDYIDNTDIFNAMYSLCVDIGLDFENHDGLVNFKEYAAMVNAYGSVRGDWNWNEDCDISEPTDGVIDVADFVVLADNWIGNFMSCDFNFDGVVDFIDYCIMSDAWNSSPGFIGWDPACDVGLPKDDYIDESDLSVLADNWLE